MTALIPKGLQGQLTRRLKPKGPLCLGADLPEAREEVFCRMVCDGLALGVAFVRAGFVSKDTGAASKLWALPRIQDRAQAILEARRATGAVTLAQVTDMLARVYAGAHAEGEYSAAHNAALSLARIYGHVTDRASVEIIRRPSRDPDAPSEQALSTWVESLPGLAISPGAEPLDMALEGPLRGAPAEPLEARFQNAKLIKDLAVNDGPILEGPRPEGPSPHVEFPNDINWLAEGPSPDGSQVGAGRPENGAPSKAVTGAPHERGRNTLLGQVPGTGVGAKPKREPRTKQVPVLKNGKVKKRKLTPRIPSARALFG